MPLLKYKRILWIFFGEESTIRWAILIVTLHYNFAKQKQNCMNNYSERYSEENSWRWLQTVNYCIHTITHASGDDVYILTSIFLSFILSQKAPPSRRNLRGPKRSSCTWTSWPLSFTVMVRIRHWPTQTPAIGKYVLHQWAIDYFWTGALGEHCSPRGLTAEVFWDSWHTWKTMCYSC